MNKWEHPYPKSFESLIEKSEVNFDIIFQNTSVPLKIGLLLKVK